MLSTDLFLLLNAFGGCRVFEKRNCGQWQGTKNVMSTMRTKGRPSVRYTARFLEQRTCFFEEKEVTELFFVQL